MLCMFLLPNSADHCTLSSMLMCSFCSLVSCCAISLWAVLNPGSAKHADGVNGDVDMQVDGTAAGEEAHVPAAKVLPMLSAALQAADASQATSFQATVIDFLQKSLQPQTHWSTKAAALKAAQALLAAMQRRGSSTITASSAAVSKPGAVTADGAADGTADGAAAVAAALLPGICSAMGDKLSQVRSQALDWLDHALEVLHARQSPARQQDGDTAMGVEADHGSSEGLMQQAQNTLQAMQTSDKDLALRTNAGKVLSKHFATSDAETKA